MKKFNTLIIGAGSIGALKPNNIETPKSKKILTHAHAIVNNDAFKLVGIIDTNKKVVSEASKKWNTDPYVSIANYVNKSGLAKKTDVVVIAVDTKQHKLIFDELLRKIRPKTIVMEKPCGNNLEEAKHFYEKCKEHKINYIENYTREYCDLPTELIYQLAGEQILAVNFFYQRGLKRDGVHAINLLNWILGRFISAKKLDYYVKDYSIHDLTYKVHLNYEKCGNVTLIPCDGREFCIFELEIITNRKRIRTVDYGAAIDVIKFKKERVYGNYKAMNYDKPERIKIDLHKALPNLYNRIKLRTKCNEICLSRAGVEVWKVIEEILK